MSGKVADLARRDRIVARLVRAWTRETQLDDVLAALLDVQGEIEGDLDGLALVDLGSCSGAYG